MFRSSSVGRPPNGGVSDGRGRGGGGGGGGGGYWRMYQQLSLRIANCGLEQLTGGGGAPAAADIMSGLTPCDLLPRTL